MLRLITRIDRALVGACCVVALLATLPSGDGFAQDTIEVAPAGNLAATLDAAEAALAAGDAPRAFALLQPLERAHAGHAYFDYLLGVAALDTGRVSAAILSLERAAEAAPQFAGARMELARAHFEAGEHGAARPLFAALLNENPPPGVRNVINQYLAAIDAGPPAPPSRFRPYAELLVGYDDNANGSTDEQQFLGFTLNPENLATDTAFFEGGAGFTFTAPTSSNFAWLLGAQAAYRSNPDASFVDSGTLGARAGMLWRSGANFGRFHVDGYAATRDGESNEAYTGANLVVGRNLSDRWDVSITLRGGALRYDDAIEVLDVDRILYTLGFGYRFATRGRFTIEAIGGSDSERQSGSPYGNSKAGGRLGLQTGIGDNSYLTASLGSLVSDYDGLFFGIAREDTQLTALLQLEFRDVLTDGLTIAPRLRYIDNDSDVSLYDYDRTEVGLLIRWEP